eukprot:365445-Chlamydomonas_euryale.AAC.16
MLTFRPWTAPPPSDPPKPYASQGCAARHRLAEGMGKCCDIALDVPCMPAPPNKHEAPETLSKGALSCEGKNAWTGDLGALCWKFNLKCTVYQHKKDDAVGIAPNEPKCHSHARCPMLAHTLDQF